jgi:para-nitrobenzyl esterase
MAWRRLSRLKVHALIFCLAACSIASISDSRRPAWPSTVVSTRSGPIAGRTDGTVNAYLGIPYAAPPVGLNRWRAPQPASRWTMPRAAKVFGASCIQDVRPEGHLPWTHEYVVQGNVSEDCLTLNLWAPAVFAKGRSVLVWIHGGGFEAGSGSVPIYDGAALARRGIIVVSMNYRLGIFGFLAHPALTKEAGLGVPANFGLQDQIAALRWIHENVSAFGGDPSQITIAGQSAGAASVHSLVVSPLTKGLFARAIAQSGLPGALPIVSLAEAQKYGEAFAREKGANSMAQLRAMTVEQLAPAPSPLLGGKYHLGLAIDGKLLPAAPDKMIARGAFNDVPMIIGQTANEGSAFSGYGDGAQAAFNSFMHKSFGAQVPSFEKFYAGNTDVERSVARRAASADRGLAMMDAWATVRMAKGKAPIWGYSFSHVEPGGDSNKWGAFHSSDIPYVFSNLGMASERNFTALDREISETLSSFWLNFVRTGNPNGAGLPVWPALDSATPKIIEFEDRARIRALLPSEKLTAYRAFVRGGGELSMF